MKNQNQCCILHYIDTSTGVGKLYPVGTYHLCNNSVACELKMVFAVLNGWKKKTKRSSGSYYLSKIKVNHTT